ncbi:MAG: type 1 glutamine amidotransferase [Burkholderiales bacterium]
MKSVAIFRHFRTEGPGYFATYLESRAIPWKLIRLDRNEPVPGEARQFSGLAFMGGPMSVNDELPWISPVLDLIRSAASENVPVIGHCLGGQLMAKAHGGSVGPAPVKEIGWGNVACADGAVAEQWLGGLAQFESFHWHGETFTIPPGAARIMGSQHCANQGYAIGPHLAMQCHVEMTEELIRTWCRYGAKEIERSAGSPGVQPVREIGRDLRRRIAALHTVADRIYQHWSEGLQR